MMALTITKLKMWKDPKYTRGCLEVPPAGSKKLPTPDYTSAVDETLRPRKGSTLTSLELPLSYTEVFDMSYLYIEASDGAGSVALFGWIDSVTLIATSSDAVRIDWSVDWWRSYSGTVTFGAGRVRRCSDSSRKRPVGIQPRYRTASEICKIYTHSDMLWVIISYRKTGTGTPRSIMVIPVGTNPYTRYHIMIGHLGAGVLHEEADAPTLLECMSGSLPAILGVTSNSIDGAWVSPICPLNDNTFVISGSNVMCHYQNYSLKKGVTYGAIDLTGYVSDQSTTPTVLSVLPYKEVTVPYGGETTDLVTYAVTDMYGNIAGSAPYGLGFSELDVVLDIGYVSCSLKVVLNTSTGTEFNKTAEGMTVTVSLPTVPISSSAYSDYVYSGQQDYEKDMKSLQNEQNAVHGLSGAIGGAVIGAAAGALLGPAGSGAGAAVGGAAMGGISGAMSAGINYAVDEFIYKDKFQDLEDKKYANQTGNLMLGGDGFGWMLFSPYPKLISLTADTVFQSELANHILQEGYPCDSPVSDVTSFITSGGALQIVNLTITGACPPVAKRTIKSLLEGGIRIVENNPSGVIP